MPRQELKTGPIVETPVEKSPQRPEREIELYNGEPPLSGDQKIPMQFPITEKCGLVDNGVKCVLKLSVTRVKNTKFEKDESGFGGQLNYDEKDIRQYKFCHVHGPFNMPNHW